MANDTIVLQSRATIQNVLPGTPRLVTPGMVITSDTFSVDGPIAGRNTDAALGGIPMNWNITGGESATLIAADGGQLGFAGALVNEYVGFSDVGTNDIRFSFRVSSAPGTGFDVRVQCKYELGGTGLYVNLTTPTQFTIGKTIDGNRSNILPGVGYVVGDVIGLQVKGGEVQAYKNGSLVGNSVFDSDVASFTSRQFAFVPGTINPVVKYSDLMIVAA